MSRSAIMLANAALVVLCCFLAARILTEVAAGVLAPAPAYASTAPPSALPEASWDDRQVILTRNLFDASTLTPALEPEDEEEIYARTKLRVRLLATVAGSPEFSWAAVEDLESRETHVVRVSDKLQGRAEVTRIERRRIVLKNAGKLEELVLDPDAPVAQAARPAASTRARPRRTTRRAKIPTPRVNDRIQQLGNDRFSVSRSDVKSVAQNPAQLFSQARILPKYDEGRMVGVQLNAIKDGSLFKQIGIKDGDVITNLNGIAITNQQDSALVLKELTEASEFSVSVTHSDGTTSSLSYELRN